MKALLTLDLPRGKRALYLRLADAMRAAIRGGRVAPGETLPSTRELAAQLGVNRHTAAAAVEELAAEGWLLSRPKAAARVALTLPTSYFVPQKTAGPKRASVHRFRLARELGLPPLASSRYPFKRSFVVGPDLRLFPYREFRAHWADALRRSGPRLLDYGDPLGQGALVEELSTYLRRVRGIRDRRVIVTHGSQEGIFLAAQLLVKPGDVVAVEDIGYRPAFSALQAAGARIVPIRVDAQGLDVSALARAAARHRLRLVYTTPLHQYPTTVTMPVSRRSALYELCVKKGIPILEDDYDHEYHYRCQPLAPLAAADPAGLVLYVSTFSKVFSPAARVGFLAVPQALAKPLADLRRIVSRQNDALLQDAVARWMRDGGFERHMRRMRRVYEERRDAAVAALERGRERGLDLGWRAPDGGMALWVETARDSAKLAAAAEERGIYVSPEAEHRLKRGAGTHVRLGFAQMTPGELRAGLEDLFDVIERVPRAARARLPSAAP